MRLPQLAIENHQFTNVLIALMVVFGVVSFFTMPRSEDPQISPAGSSVIVIYPGATPSDMEELIVDPVEEAINELEDIKKLQSTSGDGLAIIQVEFISGSDPDDKYSDVVQKVNGIRSQLPDAIVSLEIKKWTISDVQILQIALSSDSAVYRILEKEADRLKKSLERTSGVQKVSTWAFPEQEIRISLDLEKMARNRMSLNQALQAIQAANQNIPGGFIDIASRRFNVRSSGSYETLADIGNTVVRAVTGQIVYLRDIADIDYGYEDLSYYARFKQRPAVFITVSQKPGTNIFDVKEGLEQKIAAFKTKLPPRITLEAVFDQSESVENRLNGFFLNLLQGLLLVGLVILFAVGLRASLIVIIAIPISIMIGIGFIDLSGFGLQQMTITGMVIALGLLVDNAIVVTENISRFMREGYSRFDAAVKGTGQIAWAIVSSTATTVLAFVPMIMMGSITGEFIRGMPVTVVFTLSASLLVSLILTPFLSNKYLRPKDMKQQPRLRNSLNIFIETRYRGILGKALGRPVTVLAIAFLLLLMSLSTFPLIGVSFFPKAEKPQILINIDAPQGTNLQHTDSLARYVESILQEKSGIKHFATNIGHGNPRIYYNVIPKNKISSHAQIFVILDRFDRPEFDRLIQDLRSTFAMLPGAKIEVKEFEQGPPIEAPIAIRIIGDNLKTLERLAAEVEQIFAGTPGTLNINNPLGTSKTDLQVAINRDKAGMLGIPLVEIDRTVRASIAGLPASTFRDREGKEYDIVARLPFFDRFRLEQFDEIYVASVTGETIPLKQVAALTFKASPMEIKHFGLERNVTLTADVKTGLSVNETTRQIIEILEKYDWPKGYRYAVGGELESREESFGGMLQAIIVALIGIFGVLVLQFRSYSQPMIVFSAIPLAFIGSFLALLITGYAFSFTAFVGLTSLMGIVINNSIILVDYTNQLRRGGKNLITALKEAAETRFMPIILTTATTVGGLLPLTLGGGTLWAPMGWTIIGGLIVSTFLTLIIVPVLYKLFAADSL